MKKFFTLVFAALAFVSCNFFKDDPDEPVNYDALYCITSYQSGEKISKTVYGEYTGLKEVREQYVYKDNDWVYDYKIVIESTYDNNGNATHVKQSYYDESGALDHAEEFRYENIYDGSLLTECYIEALQEDGEWAKTQRLNLVYITESYLVSDIVYSDYNAEKEGYDVARKKSYSYYNGMTTFCEAAVYDAASEKWTVISETSYGYDNYSRLTAMQFDDKRTPAESTITAYYYQ